MMDTICPNCKQEAVIVESTQTGGGYKSANDAMREIAKDKPFAIKGTTVGDPTFVVMISPRHAESLADLVEAAQRVINYPDTKELERLRTALAALEQENK